MPLTPIEVDALVRGASAEGVIAAGASTRATVEAVRLALGSESFRTAMASPRIKLPVAPVEVPPTSTVETLPGRGAPAASGGETLPGRGAPVASGGETLPGRGAPAASGGETLPERGTRRPRETLHTEAIRPPNRKR